MECLSGKLACNGTYRAFIRGEMPPLIDGQITDSDLANGLILVTLNISVCEPFSDLTTGTNMLQEDSFFKS